MAKQTTPAEWSEKFKWKRPVQSVIDDIPSAPPFGDSSGTASYKEKPMELFKFTTTKPSAEVIWDTLLKADIKHGEGTSVDIFRFAMFCILQLEPDFKKAKQLATSTSRIYNAATLLGITKDQFLSLSSNIPTHYPSWVDESLYLPYYMAKQLFHLGVLGTTCFEKLFDREHDSLTKQEHDHLEVDKASLNKINPYSGLTSWMLDNVPVDYYFQDSIKINSHDKNRIPVISKDGMVTFIKDHIQKSIEVTENHLIPVGAFTHIPEFVLVPTSYAPHESEEVPF